MQFISSVNKIVKHKGLILHSIKQIMISLTGIDIILEVFSFIIMMNFESLYILKLKFCSFLYLKLEIMNN